MTVEQPLSKKEKMRLYWHKYYAENKDKLVEKQRKQIFCSACNMSYAHSSRLSHTRSNRHLENVEKQKN